MSHCDSVSSVGYPAAVESLAGRVLDVLRGTRDRVDLAGHVAQSTDTKAALAAVRVLGPDVFAPALLVSAPFGRDDPEVVAEALRIFAPSPDDAPETACLGWGTNTLLTRFGGESIAVPDGNVCALVAGASPWRDLSGSMARLAPLALPGLTGPVSEQARRRNLALNQGVVRSMLRRDYATAARLVRWAALAQRPDAPPTLDIAAVVTHLELCGALGSRTALNTLIARLLISGQPEPEGQAA